MEKFEDVKCAICTTSELEKITEKGMFGFPTHVCICKSCGLSFLNPRWDQATYQDFYENKYDKYYRAYKNTKAPENDPVSYYPIIRRLSSTFDTDKKFKNILDIGSGDGSKLQNFIDNKLATNYYAIEPSATHEEQLTSRGIEFISNDVDSDWDKSYENHFDFIIMRHVLEHCLDPVEVLQKLKNVLTEDGIIYIAVPDAYAPTVAFTDSFFRVVHTYYFNKISLANILNKSGYEVVSMVEGDKHHNDELFVFGKKSETAIEPIIDKATYDLQRKIFVEGLKKEKSLDYQIKRTAKKAVDSIVKIKKSVFPNPIIKK